MKVIEQEELLTKFETFIIMRKELTFTDKMNEFVCDTLYYRRYDSMKQLYGTYYLKLMSNKNLYENIQRYITDTTGELIPKELHSQTYRTVLRKTKPISKKIVQFFKDMNSYGLDKEEKTQLIDVNSVDFMVPYVILNNKNKEYEEYKVQEILNLLKEVYVSKKPQVLEYSEINE